MQSNSLPHELTLGLPFHRGERRKNPRFDMRFPVFLRKPGDPWTVSETSDVSAAGASFVANRPFLLSTPVEYVLTFPSNLTKAPQPLRVRFFGTVLRCERVADRNGVFSIAVRNTAHRYLTREESASFDSMEQRVSLPVDSRATNQTYKPSV